MKFLRWFVKTWIWDYNRTCERCGTKDRKRFSYPVGRCDHCAAVTSRGLWNERVQ